MPDKKVIDLNGAGFDTAIAEGITLVDCWAPWCGPCRIQGPILEDVANAISDQAKITKLNIDETRSIAERFGVQAIPTLLLFKDGNEVQRFIGVQSKEVLIDAISSTL